MDDLVTRQAEAMNDSAQVYLRRGNPGETPNIAGFTAANAQHTNFASLDPPGKIATGVSATCAVCGNIIDIHDGETVLLDDPRLCEHVKLEP